MRILARLLESTSRQNNYFYKTQQTETKTPFTVGLKHRVHRNKSNNRYARVYKKKIIYSENLKRTINEL